MADKTASLGGRLRPHGKTAKSIDVMRHALRGPTAGITVSTLKEAEYYFGQGINDLIYAVGIDPGKLPRALRLIHKGADLTLLLETKSQ